MIILIYFIIETVAKYRAKLTNTDLNGNPK